MGIKNLLLPDQSYRRELKRTTRPCSLFHMDKFGIEESRTLLYDWP